MNSKNELGIIVASAIVFLLGIYGIVNNIPPLGVVCFTAESCLLVWLNIRFLEKREATEAIDEGMDEAIRQLEQDKIELKQRIYALEKEIEKNGEDRNNDAKEVEEERKRLLGRIEKLENAPVMERAEAFLPPIDSNESDSETINIIKIAKDTIEELEPYAKEAGIQAMISATEESLLVRGNTSRMKILFRNIIDNSIKYMKKQGNLIITISNIGDDIFVVCKDNGRGLPEPESKHVFELNYQGTNRISGNGLGLTQAKAIVDYYGGTIYAKSNIDKGMGIYIQLPTR